MSGEDDDSDKSFEPTEQKLRKAREKGDVAKSTDLSVAASYLGILVAFYTAGTSSVEDLGTALMAFLDQPEKLAPLFFEGPSTAPAASFINSAVRPILPWFMVPFALVLLSIVGQRALVFAPSKLEPKLSRISIIQNAKNKLGRSGLFEFCKSFFKLILYSICMGVYLSHRLPEMVASAGTGPQSVIVMLSQLSLEFLFLALVIALAIGIVDAAFQHAEHRRKNMMSRKEIQDEMKSSEGDPHMKSQRRQRGQKIAMGQMLADVPKADVVVVNPTHYAVALQWSREPGTAPVCVAKGVDEVAATIRRVANENAVPIHSDPPTARALHAAVEIGEEILEEHYAPVAAAIRFAEEIRKRAKGKIT